MINYIILFSIITVVGGIIYIYNNLITKKNAVKNAWAQIDVQLKRRADLIPNLLASVKGYMEHEKNVLENVIKARNLALKCDDNDINSRINCENKLSGSLSSLLAVVESYPELKANENFLQLNEELSSTENKIAFARQFYNDSIMFYNNALEMFPNNIIASFFDFKQYDEFKIVDEKDKEVPKVSF